MLEKFFVSRLFSRSSIQSNCALKINPALSPRPIWPVTNRAAPAPPRAGAFRARRGRPAPIDRLGLSHAPWPAASAYVQGLRGCVHWTPPFAQAVPAASTFQHNTQVAPC